MDQLDIPGKIKELYKKYRYGIWVVLLGIILMCWPSGKRNATVLPQQEVTEVAQESGMEESLRVILSQIKGAGKVEVLLTEAKGAETIYQQDVNSGNDTSRQDTVIISGTDRAQSGLVSQVNPPCYMGAIVVCPGADSPAVRLAIVQAVSSVTGLGADRIAVLKMK